MFEYYQKTDLENRLENLYIKNNILTIYDLSIKNVAKKLNIDVVFMEDAKEVAIWDEKATAIFLNPSKSEDEIRATFFHELCHPLRHYGDQVKNIGTFTLLQEKQANQFMLYASMPFFMIERMEMPRLDYQWSYFLAHHFNMPINIAKQRANQILQRVQQASIDEKIKRQRSFYKISNDPNNWSEETHVIMNKLYKQIRYTQR
ncbi:ImmA/IrrE family metallo-endopeptidase [Paraliobacillus ryukyuensis]|uniref:ImmA/IrrE family metallo-endopeptidase n=1 Tax=Paraliobacillus ryukyuensis TaxID=200904 RepID=UPI0009A8E5F8|nr:ImmA/IrrE family metallo-endopeptidase [Paraliobacillus ryukyuensis]